VDEATTGCLGITPEAAPLAVAPQSRLHITSIAREKEGVQPRPEFFAQSSCNLYWNNREMIRVLHDYPTRGAGVEGFALMESASVFAAARFRE
jgi:hypothetical protein